MNIPRVANHNVANVANKILPKSPRVRLCLHTMFAFRSHLDQTVSDPQQRSDNKNGPSISEIEATFTSIFPQF
jgi:hypothetical protein